MASVSRFLTNKAEAEGQRGEERGGASATANIDVAVVGVAAEAETPAGQFLYAPKTVVLAREAAENPAAEGSPRSVSLSHHEAGVQILLDEEIEEGVDDALALSHRDLADGFAFEVLILLEHRGLDPHVVEPPAGMAGRGDLPARTGAGASDQLPETTVMQP
jgi:hypothetical protein